MAALPGVIDQNDFSNQYNTPIPSARQGEFNDWLVKQKAKTGRDPLHDRYDYDVNGFFLSGQGTDERGHATDQFKKPNHPTFSNESIYHGKDGNYGGRWITQAGKTFFEPGVTNLNHHTAPGLKSYFDMYEPDVTFLPPPGKPPIPAGLK